MGTSNAQSDISLVFGVKGGGEISQGTSGELIQRQLAEIVKKINANPFKIKFQADEDSLKQLKNQIQKIMGTISVPVESVTSTKSKTSSSGTGAVSGGAAEDEVKITEKKLSNINKALLKLETLRHQITQTQDSIARNDALDGFLQQTEDAATKVAKLTYRVQNFKLKQSEFNKAFDIAALEVKKASDAVKEYESNLKSIDTMDGTGDKNIEEKAAATTEALKKIEAVRHSIEMARASVSKIEDQGVAEQYVGEQGSLTKLSATINQMQQDVKSHTMSQSKFNEALAKTDLEVKKNVHSIQEYNAKLRNTKTETKENLMTSAQIRQANEQIRDSIEEISKARMKYGALGLRSGHEDELRALNDYDVALETLRKQLNEGTISQEEFNASMTQIRSGVTDATASLSKYDSALGTLKTQFDKLSVIAKEALGLYSMHMVVSKGVQLIKSMVNNAIELESAFADTRIVTHATTEELKQFGVEITSIASDTAASIDSLVSAATAFARLGYSLEESTILAKYTGMLEKVGNVDTQRAEDAVTSIVKAFPDDVTVQTIEDTMDKLVKTGNNFPISVDQIAEGMTNASSALAAAGNDFKQSVALLTAANTTVQNASKASTALRTISARLRKTKSELDELGEAMTESQHDAMIKALANYKVSLVDVNGEYKSTYEIMQEIAAEWHNMTSMEQAAIAELVAGTRQQVVFYSIVEHFEEATNAMKAMSDSAGTLSKSYNIYLGTTAAQLERFDIAWKTFSMDFVNNSALKGLINIGTALLNIADKLQRVHMLIPTIIAGINVVKKIKMSLVLIESKKAIDALATSMMQTGVVTEGLKQDFLRLSAAERKQVIDTILLDTTMDEAEKDSLLLSIQMQGLAVTTKGAGASAAGTAVAMGAMSVAEGSASAATWSLSAAIKDLMASNPIGWLVLLASVVVSAAVGIADYIKKAKDSVMTVEDLKQKLEELSNSSKETADRLSDIKNATDDTIPRFIELSKGVDRFGNKTEKLTDAEYAEFVDLSNQLAELFPELKIGMDENGNAMLNLSGSADKLAESLQKVVDAQTTIARAEIAGNMQEAIEAYKQVDKLYEPAAITALNSIKEDMISGNGSITYEVEEYLREIRAISPEIDAVFKKLGTHESVGGGIELYTILGSGSKYKTEEAFYKDLEEVLDKTRERLKSELNIQDAQNTIASSMLMQTAMAWLQNQPAYSEASSAAQALIEKIVQGVDVSKINLPKDWGESDLQAYIYTNVLKPINEMSDETKDAVDKFISATTSFAGGKSSVRDMKNAVSSVSKALKTAGIDAEMMTSILDALGATELSEKIDLVTKSITGEADAVEGFVNALSESELENVYQMLTMSKNGELPLDTVITQLNLMKTAADEAGKSLSEVLDLTGFMESLEKTASNISSVVSMMKKLKEGTALTATEVINLAKQYPELLQHSNLFVDKSVEGQQKLLNAVIESNRLQYQSTVKTQVDLLKKSLERIEKQSAAELLSALSWTKAQETLNDPNVPNYVKDEIISKAQYEMRRRIIEEINSIENFGTELIDAALSGLDDIGVSDSSLSSGSSSSGSSSNNPIAQWMSWAKHIRSIGAENANNLGDAQYLIQLAQTIFDNIWNGVVSEDEARSYIEELVKGIKDLESKVKKSIDDLVSYRLKMLQEAKKQEKKDLEDRLSALKDFYSKQKDMLKDQRDEEKYLDEQAEKRKSVSDIQAQIDQLSYDNSAWAEKRRAELYSDLAGAQKELSEFESDHALDVATEFLDKQYEEQEASIQREIDAIEDILNDPNTLYNQALVEIQSSSEAIYKEMKEYGANNLNNGINEAEKLLDAAAEAIATYNEYRDATVGRPTAYNGRFVPGSHGSNEIEWVIEDGYIIPVIRKGGYASGTPNASAGLHRIDENGTETIFTTAAGNTYRVFSHGDKVLDANSSSFLYEFAKSKGQNLKLLSGVGGGGGLSALSSGGGQVVVNTGNIIINGSADERTVSEIRRAQRENVEMILRELNRLNR